MANDARSSCKVKDNENSNSKEVASKLSTGSGAETSNAFGLRRSVRETPPKKNMTPSPSSIRKSERLEKHTLTPPSMRKSERLEKQNTPISLRRSERGKKQSSSSSSGSKKSKRSLGLSVVNKKLKKERSVKQLTIETEEISNREKHATKSVQVGKKRIDACGYRALFKQQPKKVTVEGLCKEWGKDEKLSLECISNDEATASKNVDMAKEYGEKKVQELREVSGGTYSEKTLEESNFSASKPSDEIVENNHGLESSHASQNHKVGEAHLSEDGDSVQDSTGGDCALLSACKTMPRKLDVVAETEKKKLDPELLNPLSSKGAQDNDVHSDTGYKEISLKRKRNKVDTDSDATAMVSSKDICPSAADTIISSPGGNNFAETCAACFKQKRENHDSKCKDLCLCTSNLNPVICGSLLSEDRRGNGADVSRGVTKKCITNMQNRDCPADFELENDQNTCLICKLPGKILCCEGRGCRRSYHLSCLDPPLKDVPLGDWYCLSCVKKKIKLGAHSVSEGIESIWKQVETSEENGLQKKQYFVKYKGLAHVHNRWVSESQLLLEAPSLAVKFNRKNQVLKWKQEWTVPRRMLQKRLLKSPKQLDEVHGGCVDDDSDCSCEWLVKWHGLDYEHASWELENASFMKLPEAQSLMRDYDNRLERAKKGHCLSRTYKELEIEKGSVKSTQLSAGGFTELDNNHLNFISNLRQQWYKGQNVIVVDDQDRIMKVITFITSFSSNECWPFLIVTSSAAFCSWDEEFFRLAPSIDAVVYHGSKDVRRDIRTVELYAGGAVMFDVLITSPEVIAEDLEVLESIKWEAVIVDECQRSRIYSHVEPIKSLHTEMRLLLFNGQLKDDIIERLLSLLDCQSDIIGSEGLLTNSNLRVANLKEKLSKYIVNGSKSDTSRFVEYWVPAQISNAQLEQYCATLHSNSLLLCSSKKNDLVGSLRDILILNRKCCDHPYIMNPGLHKVLTEDNKVPNGLDVDIKASGKLQLLDAMLSEIRNRGLRALILFQSSRGSGKDNIGDILDDFLSQRFGGDSYERVDGLVNRTKKQASLNNFNNQKSRFVFLLETRACLPSIKLSSVDTVIIYSSDWSLANDIRCLQKITLDTQFEQLKIFRLYSSFTVEENVLILAKQGKTLDSNLQSISGATSRNLLIWGVSYLFCKLDEFHSGCILSTSRGTPFEPASYEDTVQEILTILPQNTKDNNMSNSSVILKAKQNQGHYSTDFPLPGEHKIQLSDADVPHIFWKKLLAGKQPKWKYSSGLSQRNRKRVQQLEDLKKLESDGEEVVKKRKKVANNEVDQALMKSLEENKVAGKNEGNFGAASHNTRQLMSGSTSQRNASHANKISTSPRIANKKLEVPTVNMAKSSERFNLRDSQKTLCVLLKPEIAKLCDILQFPEDVKAMAQSFLEYVMNNHCVIREPATILQAFHISLCWTAASLLKYKLDHKESFALAKQHLNFSCRKEEADYVYSMLRCLKKMFLYHKENFTPGCPVKTSESLTPVVNKDHHVKPSVPTPSTQQKVKVDFEDLGRGQKSFDYQVLSQLGQQDFSRSIKDIEKKCDKLMRKLLQKQQAETEELKRKYQIEKSQLENKQKMEAAVIRLHSSSSMRTDKLKLLDIEYRKKVEELKRQMEINCKKLEEMHMAARKKLEGRKEHWVEGVVSWANIGLINKPSSSKTGNNQENECSLNSHLEKQNLELVQSIKDGEVPVEVPEAVSSNDDEDDLLAGVLSSKKQISDGVKSNVLDEEAPVKVGALGVPEAVSSGDGRESAAKLSSNEQISNRASVMVPNRKLSIELPVNTNGTDGSENTREPETALPKAMDDSTTIARENNVGTAMPSDNAIQSNQQDRVICFVNQDPCSIMGDNAGEQEDGKIVEDEGRGNGISDSPDKTVGVTQHEEETPSGVPEIACEVEGGETRQQRVVEAPSAVPLAAAGAFKGNETSKKQDGTLDTQDSESLNRHDRDLSSRVIETAPGEVVEDASTSEEINGVCVRGSFNTRSNQQDGLIPFHNMENVPSIVVGGDRSDKEIDGVVSGASHDNLAVVPRDRVASAINEDSHPEDPSLAVQEQCLQQTTARLQDVVASAFGDHNSLQQVTPSVYHQDNDVASNRTNTDASFMEHVLQMSSMDSDLSPNAIDLPSASETEHQTTYGSHTTINIAESSMQMAETMERLNQAVSQPATHLLQHVPTEIPLGGSGMHVSDSRTASISAGTYNHAAQTAPPVRVPPLPLYHDPLQNELERIRKERDRIITIHEETKLRLKSDCEKEIEEVVAQIRRKYETKYQDMESEFLLKKKELDTNHSKVLMNKILAEAFRSKCMDIKASTSSSMQQDVPSSFMQQLLQLSSQPHAQKNAIVSGPSSASPSVGPSLHAVHRSLTPGPSGVGPQAAIPNSHSTVPSFHVIHRSSAPVPGTSTRPPLINSMSPASGNLQIASEVRSPSAPVPSTSTRPPLINSISPASGNLQIASDVRSPAPHLQPFRPVASTIAANTSSPAIGMPGNTPTISASTSQVQLRPQQTLSQNIGHQFEGPGMLPPLSPASLSALDNVVNQNSNLSSINPHSDLGSNTDAMVISEIGPQSNTSTTVKSANEVVCLSDDD